MNSMPILEMNKIRKSFDKSLALDNVQFELLPGEIHGLLGGNGAGKTTLMNILFGLYKMDSGEIRLKGQPISVQSPHDALNLKIGMVHQHFLQISNFTVLENIVLGTKVKKKYNLDLTAETSVIKALQERFSLDMNLSMRVEDLPMGTRQKIEILKALYRGVEILILDEPTTNLTPQEVDDLFKSLRVMVNEGLSIVFITHKLREVLSVCDRISVLRNGKNVLTLKRTEANEEAFVRGMVGEDMDLGTSIIFDRQTIRPDHDYDLSKNVLKLNQVQLVSAANVSLLKNISMDLHPGEILGVSGVAGNGQRELAEVIMGIQSIQTGEISLDDQSIRSDPTDTRLGKGIAYIPEDRLHDGFLPKASIAHNLILGYQKQVPYAKNGLIDWKNVFEKSNTLIHDYQIKTSGPGDIGGNLSGGNIQRVLIARAFSNSAHLLVAHNPTRGLDIPSMDFVYSRMLDMKKRGSSILLISEDLDELLLMCDRIAVMYKGELVGILDRSRFEKYQIGRMMSGYKTEE